MIIVRDQQNQLVTIGRLADMSPSVDKSGLFEKDVAPVDMNTHAWDASICDFAPLQLASDHPPVAEFEFLLKFTTMERAAIRAHAETDIILKDALELARAAPRGVDIDNPLTQQMLDYLVQQNLISNARRLEIIDSFNVSLSLIHI